MLAKIYRSKKTQVILVIALILTMTLANILFLGKNLISYAYENNLEMQNEETRVSKRKI